MTSISSIGSSAWSVASQALQRPPQKLSAKLQEDFDADGSGGLDTTELQSLMDDMSSRTGQSSSTNAKDLLAASDTNSDGSLSANELEAALPSMMPAPSTMAFAQSRGASSDGTDDLFSKVDSDGSGSLSSDELTGMLQKMTGDQSVSQDDAKALFSALDSDGDGALSQSEFDAGRPQNAGGMPPSLPAQTDQTVASTNTEGSSASTATASTAAAGGAEGTSGAGGTNSSTVYDELDTNEDGVVSTAERLAGAIKDAAEAQAAASKSTTATANSKDDATGWSQRARDALVDTVNRAYQAASGAATAATSTIRYAV